MEIRQYHLKSWQDTGPVPDSEFAILNVINRIQSWQHEAGNHPIIVHCRLRHYFFFNFSRTINIRLMFDTGTGHLLHE